MSVSIFVLDVDEFHPLVVHSKEMPGVIVSGPLKGYWRIESSSKITFDRKELGFKPAVWYGSLTGGYVGKILEFSRDTLIIDEAI